MVFDIVVVTYNSAKWLAGCLAALANVQYDIAGLNLIFVDNASADGTLQALEALQLKYTGFGGFAVLPQQKNRGFSAGCNAGARAGGAPFIFFLNADTEVQPGIFAALVEAAEHAPEKTAAFECRQLPFETGHHIHPVTLQTTWAAGAALVVRRAVFEEIGGFDEHLFMYCEDVDLSWRVRAAGYTLQYVPKAEVVHYSYLSGEDGKTAAMKLTEYAGSFYGNLLLRYKFGSCKEIWRGHAMYWGALRRPLHFDGVRRVLAKNYLRHFLHLWSFWFWRVKNRRWFKAKPAHFEGGFAADRGLFKLEKPRQQPLVTVVGWDVDSAPCTLQSLKNQTYENYEVLDAGRDVTGGFEVLRHAKGEYVVFFGPDQYFYPDHLELMVAEALENPDADVVAAAYMAGAEETGPYVLVRQSAWTLPKEGGWPPLQCFMAKSSFVRQCERGSLNGLYDAMTQKQGLEILRATTVLYARRKEILPHDKL